MGCVAGNVFGSETDVSEQTFVQPSQIMVIAVDSVPGPEHGERALDQSRLCTITLGGASKRQARAEM